MFTVLAHVKAASRRLAGDLWPALTRAVHGELGTHGRDGETARNPIEKRRTEGQRDTWINFRYGKDSADVLSR